jgi:hypothetical protein
MHKLFRLWTASAYLGAGLMPLLFSQGCAESAEAKVKVEKLPEVQPSLPQVPTLPPPPHPIQHPDQSYSVYGLRKRLRNTIDTEVSVTAYIVKIFEPPACEKGQRCPTPPAPHLWLADTVNEDDKSKMLLLAGYAENHQQIEDAIKDAKKGKKNLPPEETGLLPVPTDFEVGAKIKASGRFAYVSGSGFHSSEGVRSYGGHERLQ